MCEKIPGPRCASDTCENNDRTLVAYESTHPDGPQVNPLALADAQWVDDAPAVNASPVARLVDRLNLNRGSLKENMDLHLGLLASEEGLDALADQLAWSTKPERRALLLRAYRTGYDELARRIDAEDGSMPRVQFVAGWDHVAPLEAPEDIARVSFDLYGYDRSPLRTKALEAEKAFYATVTRHPAGEPATVRFDTGAAATVQNADLDGLPSNVVAFDIETDTTDGRGFQPHRGKITELVLADKDETIVLSGDERHILQGFADYMNSRVEPTTALGWNSRNFDIPFIAVRKQAHPDIEGWGMQISDADVASSYPTGGGFETGQQMTWTTPTGVVHGDEDVMLTYAGQKGWKAAKLKDSARDTGMNPIELDRARMHEYSQEERDGYVCSDGIATLHNHVQTRRRALVDAVA